MRLEDYRLGDRVEVHINGEWYRGTVANPKTTLMPLIVHLDAGSNFPVMDAGNVRLLAGLAAVPLSGKVAIRDSSGTVQRGMVHSLVEPGRYLIDTNQD